MANKKIVVIQVEEMIQIYLLILFKSKMKAILTILIKQSKYELIGKSIHKNV